MSGYKSPIATVTLVLALAVASCTAKKDDATAKQSADGSVKTKKLELDAKEKEQRAAEAVEAVRKIYEGAYAYYLQAEQATGDRARPAAAAMFPLPSTTPTPPLGSCCKYPRGLCPVNPKDWQREPWRTIGFALTSPSSYSYEYTVNNNPSPAAAGEHGGKGKTFTVRAFGDLDCDGDYTTFQLIGVSEQKEPNKSDTAKLTITQTKGPKLAPTKAPKLAPTKAPKLAPTKAPKLAPTEAPKLAPTKAPKLAPTKAPPEAPVE